jgi:sigma-B regulation protein RsbU (phosphoserine phosphatase)
MINPILTAPPRANSALGDIRGLAEEYARAHEVGVRLWERADDGWVLSISTSSTVATAPGPSAVGLELPDGRSLLVEVQGPDPEASARSSRFLADAMSRAVRYDAESRFFGRELAERYEEITLLYTISEVLGSVISLEQAAATILSEVSDTMGVERAALWIFNAGTGMLEQVSAVGENADSAPISVDDPSSVTAAVFRNRAPMMLEPSEEYPRQAAFRDANHDFFLSVPVSYSPPRGETRTIGVINLIGRTVQGGFSAGDQKLITAIASQIGAAVENSRLVADSLRQERLSREMELAHDLQLKLLPSTAQFRGFFNVAARCSPADSVGGDFYHLFRLPGGRIGVMIGDVSSHGFAAALIMALTMSAVAIHASEGDPPAEVLRRVHAALISELETTEMYMTLFYGVIDPEAGTLTYANAGHSHAFRVTGQGEAIRLNATNPPFGLLDLDDYGEQTVPWQRSSDMLFLFTDGLSDALGLAGEEVLIRHVREHSNEPLESLLDSLFSLSRPESEFPADDRSALLLRA